MLTDSSVCYHCYPYPHFMAHAIGCHACWPMPWRASTALHLPSSPFFLGLWSTPSCVRVHQSCVTEQLLTAHSLSPHF